MMQSEIHVNDRKLMQADLEKLGATERLRKNVGRKGYAVARAIQALGDLTRFDCWGDEKKELVIIRFGYSLIENPDCKKLKKEELQEKLERREKREKEDIKQKDTSLLQLANKKVEEMTNEGFKRSFNTAKIIKSELLDKLKKDVKEGIVFPTVRKNEIHFYYAGGCLYKWNGKSFRRDSNYEKYSPKNAQELDYYSLAKEQNRIKNETAEGMSKERQLLDCLNTHTFKSDRKSKVVVLDIEVRLNGEMGKGKKCDLVLMNIENPEMPKIMFVEGKVFSDSRVNVQVGRIPEVIEQVKTYTEAVKEQSVEIVFEYINHINCINELFDTNFYPPFPGSLYNFNFFGYDLFVENHLVPNAKLLVYETPQKLNANGKYSKEIINKELGANNVMWVQSGTEPTLDEIWEALCK